MLLIKSLNVLLWLEQKEKTAVCISEAHFYFHWQNDDDGDLMAVRYLDICKVTVKLSLSVMKAYSSQLCLHSFLTSVTDGGEWLPPSHGCFTLGRSTSRHWTGGWVGPRACLYVSRREVTFDIRTVQLSSLVTIPTALPRRSFYCCSKHFSKSWNSLFNNQLNAHFI